MNLYQCLFSSQLQKYSFSSFLTVLIIDENERFLSVSGVKDIEVSSPSTARWVLNVTSFPTRTHIIWHMHNGLEFSITGDETLHQGNYLMKKQGTELIIEISDTTVYDMGDYRLEMFVDNYHELNKTVLLQLVVEGEHEHF